MRHLTVSVLVTLAVLLGSATEGWSLPPCPAERHPTNSPWSNCFGTWTFADGDKYVGEYKDEKRHGQGTYTFADGGKYVGELRGDKWHGQGTFIFADGGKYIGEWKDDRRDGFGVFTYKDGTIYSGQFSAEYPGKWGKHGNGKIVFLDGRRFEGRWINNYPSDGILTGRTGKNISLDYGWDRGKFRGGSLYKIIISFEGGAKFIGEVDRRYNPTKGEFIDKFGKKIDPKKFADFFLVSSFFR